MAISASPSPDGACVTIHIDGRFDFSKHTAFRDAYKPFAGHEADYVVDMRNVDYIDSSALGMLRDHAGGAADRVQSEKCNPEVEKILRIANFDRRFKLR